MTADEKIRVLIIGAGVTGTNLFNTIIDEPGVMLTGIVDRKNEFSSLDLACTRGIPVIKEISEAMKPLPDIVFHLTESDVPSSEILVHKAPQTEIIEDGGILFFLNMIHQSRRKILRRVHRSGEKITENLAYSETCLQTLFDHSPDMIVTTDAEMRIVGFSKAAERILGYTRKEMAGISLESAWLDPEEGKEVLQSMWGQGSLSNCETRFKTKSGQPIDVALTLSCIRNANGGVTGTVGIIRNMTEGKNLKPNSDLQELNENPGERLAERTMDLPDTNRDVERWNKAKSDFIAAVSHELRTPLNAILGFSELLQDDTTSPLTDIQKRHVENIRTSGGHLLRLTNNIMDLAKIESGRDELKYETFPLQNIVSEVESVIRPLANKKSLQFDIRIADDIPFVRADRTKFIQILYNLLSNAVKFTPQEGRIILEAVTRDGSSRSGNAPSLSAGPETAEAFLELRVADTGIGIREEDRFRIFNEFEQVAGSHTSGDEGTGLGLALTKKLVELHGGRICLESDYGQGSTFIVTIPLTTETISEISVFPAEEADTSEYDEGLFLNQKKRGALILLVEDDPATAELLTQLLNREGYRTVHVFNGNDAVKRVQELRPFAVLLDIMLPGKDGWQVLQELKSDPDIRDIPVIILSVLGNQDLGSALGAVDYLIKPVDRGALVEKLGELTGVRNAGKNPLNILCIDGNEGAPELLRGILEPAGYHVITAKTGKEGMGKALTFRPDLIILDLMFPDMDGFELSRTLHNNVATMDIPLIIMTAKDVNVEARLKLIGKIESTLQKSCFTEEDLLAHIRDLEMTYPFRTGLLDTVSGLFDRSYFQIRLAQEICRADRYKTIFSILMADLDDFGNYIRANGIHNGNLCIRKIADFLRKTTRGSDTIVRYGRDEFALLLASATEEASRIVAQRLLSFMESYRFPGQEHLKQGKLTASIAVVYYNRISPSSTEEMISKTQELLREAKKHGGGNIRIYGQPAYTAEIIGL